MKKKNQLIPIIILFFLAFILRLAFLLFLKRNYFFYNYPSTDVLFYLEWAREIAYHNWLGDRVFSGMPLFPYFLAILDRLTLGNLFGMRLIHILLGSINCILIFYVTKKIFSEKVAFLAMVLSATNFTLIYYDWLMMPVTLLITLSLLIAISLIHLSLQSSKREWFFLGVLIGLGLLGDGKFLFFFLLIIPYLVLKYKKETSHSYLINRILCPLLIGFFLIPSAVTLRNRVIGGEWVFISRHGGINFYIGNNSKATGIFANPNFLRPDHIGHSQDSEIIAQQLSGKALTKKEVSRFWVNEAFRFMTKHPISTMRLLGKKFFVFFSDNENAYDLDLLLQKDWKDQFDINPFGLIIPLAILGILISFKANPKSAFMNLIILSQLIFTLIFYLLARHRATIIPFLLIYQAASLNWFVRNIHIRQYKRLLVGLFIVVLLLFLLKSEQINPKAIEFLKVSKSGPILVEREEYEHAKKNYFKALKIRPQDVNTLYNLGTAFFLQKNYPMALKYYNEAKLINPYEVNVLFNLGRTFEELGQRDKALQQFYRVISLDNRSIDAHFRIAEIFRYTQNCSEAIKNYKKIIEIDSSYSKEVNGYIEACSY